MKQRRSIKERIAITLRGYGLLKKYCPGLAKERALAAIISSLQPFVAIWFNAQIINEISGERRINIIIMLVIVVVFINFAISLLKNIIDKLCSEKETQMWNFFGKIFSDKQMFMDYVDLENAEIQQQRKQAQEDLYMFGNGLAQLVWGIAGLVNAPLSIIVSIAMSITLFTQEAGNKVIDSPVWIGVLLLCIFLGGLSSSKATLKENRVFEEWCKNTVWFKRMFQFFGYELYINPERAKDLRIYEQNYIAERVINKLVQGDKESNSSIFKMAILPSLACVVIGISNAVCWLFVIAKAYLGAFGVGSIVQYVGVLGRLSESIQDIIFTIVDNEVYCSHLQGLYDFLDIPNRKYQGTIPVEKRAFCDEGDNDYRIEFRDVSFQYPSTNTYALHHVSLKIQNGQRLALVGMNGSGKTTFIKLLCRLYDPTEGEILLNGINIKKYNYEEYMSIFSVVFQDFKLFSFSIGQNVATSVESDRSKVEECLKEAGFGERLLEMPEGIDTCLYKDFDEKGVEISGGEAQKIALARALYKNAPYIVLDEPTAALDPIAEQEIYSKFNDIAGKKTAIYISHRLSSCRFCDEIAVFHNGQIVQKGSHSELVDIGGMYHELWYAQAQYYSE